MYWVFNFLVIYVKVNVEKRKGFGNFYQTSWFKLSGKLYKSWI